MPDGTKVTDATNPTGKTPTPVKKMPDGSKPSSVTTGWWTSLWTVSHMPSWRWPSGTKLPSGCQKLDGSRLPDGAEPQPDGYILLIDGSRIPAEEVVMPDGTKVTDATNPTGNTPTPVKKMPDGSKPSSVTTVTSGWWTAMWTSTAEPTMSPSTAYVRADVPSTSLPGGVSLCTDLSVPYSCNLCKHVRCAVISSVGSECYMCAGHVKMGGADFTTPSIVQGTSVPTGDLLVPIVDVADVQPPQAEGGASSMLAESSTLEPALSEPDASSEIPGTSGPITHTDDQKKKSRFGLPSFMSPAKRKEKKEGRTGAVIRTHRQVLGLRS